jgi:hypothetical protein
MPFKASRGWREKYINSSLFIATDGEKISQNLLLQSVRKLIEFQCFIGGLC